MILARGKNWRDKLNHPKQDLPRVERIEGTLRDKWGKGTCVIPAPIEVDQIMRRVPRGKLITINEIRQKLAKKHKATIGCPITTGIFAWIAANAAEEAVADGVKQITPYWRTLKTGGELNPKYPGGASGLKKKLQAEGHKIVRKGKRYLVADYEKKLVKP
jgi:hypothetical protein